MKCPYNSNQVTTHHKKKVDYDRIEVENADGTPDVLHCTGNDFTDTTIFYQHDCLEKDCAAWQNGRCVRTG
jgi:hypothetical protein